MDSAIAQVVRTQKELVEKADQVMLRELAKRWLDVEKSLEAQITLLSEQIEGLAKAGKAVPIGRVYRLERFKSLLRQTQERVALYTQEAAQVIAERQASMVAVGVQHAQDVLGGAVGGQFDKLSTMAVESMIAATSGVVDNAPLRNLLFKRMVRGANGEALPGIADRLAATLTKGVAFGWNPKKTAKYMRNDLAEGLNKALLIARTETMRAYRMGNTTQMRESGVVEGQVRMCAHTPSTCAACLADEGNVYPLDEPLPDHPRGRCTGVPIIKGMPKPTFETGEAWLKKQGEETQLAILGKKRLDLWKSGGSFSDFATKTEHAVWGGGLQVTPISQLSASS